MATPATLGRRLSMLAQDSNPAARIGLRQRAALVCAVLVLIALTAVPMGRAAALAAEQVANLEFYLVDGHANAYQAQHTGKVPAGDRLYLENGRPVLLQRKPIVSSAALREVSTKVTEYGTLVRLRFDDRVSASMLRATRLNIGNRMAVVYVDQGGAARVVSDAFIRGQFGTEFEISGLSAQQAQTLAAQFGHALPR